MNNSNLFNDFQDLARFAGLVAFYVLALVAIGDSILLRIGLASLAGGILLGLAKTTDIKIPDLVEIEVPFGVITFRRA